MADTNRKAIMAPGEQERIDQALAALAKDTHSPREISVKYILHVHNEFPKHVKVGEDKDGNAITKVVQNPAEESEISVKYILHVHNEFPKHVKVGEDKDGNAITKVVQNPAEESAALAAAKSEEPTVQ